MGGELARWARPLTRPERGHSRGQQGTCARLSEATCAIRARLAAGFTQAPRRLHAGGRCELSAPLRCTCAMTMAVLAVRPRVPGQNLAAVRLGVSSSNSCVSGTYVAVVSRARMLEPWPSSVCA
eukprot:3517337-Prymnesium_polylepis.2